MGHIKEYWLVYISVALVISYSSILLFKGIKEIQIKEYIKGYSDCQKSLYVPEVNLPEVLLKKPNPRLKEKFKG